ncbi:DNA starvation/stationary phase protection protein Dps [Loktanella sp. DJP18]|uniref:DNA starvation/stationary phase protection protein Dps n=1 Tax=Loktanella sp. DJP18 TaxID=3409788 RepID=UPI003BB5E1C8
MPDIFVDGLDGQARKKSVDVLNACVAETIALRLSVKQAHWNLKGSGFIGVHELLDDVSARLGESTDTMAERAVILGGFARGTLEVVIETAEMDAYPVEENDITAHIKALKDRFLSVGKKVRKGIDEAGDAGDEDTADVLTEVSRALDKDAWFIGANAPT